VKALIHENVSLAPLTTFRIGGLARYFADAISEEAILDAVRFAKQQNLPLFVLGGGSNLLVADTGFQGIVVHVGLKGVHWESNQEQTVVRAAAGEPWDAFVAAAVERDLGGIECLSGIPGLVGGTPVQNVGAYGQEVSEVLVSVRAYDRDADRVVDLSCEACAFGYRSSLFNTTAKDRYIVLQVTYALRNDGAPSIRYADVQREFEDASSTATLHAVRSAVLRIRARKAMLLVEGDPDCRSAGSFFKNPIVGENKFAEIQSSLDRPIPRYPAATGQVKMAAAWLIENAGFAKGYALGPVGLSTKHTLALVNRGNARADDILKLAREIRSRVYDRFGIELCPEPVFLGFPPGVLTESARIIG
jgi:UDP-N-acetylmuramate dehydrogenase